MLSVVFIANPSEELRELMRQEGGMLVPYTKRKTIRTVDERILTHLQKRPKEIYTYTELSKAVWGTQDIRRRPIENAVARLRNILGPDIIETIYGIGIRLNVDF